MLHLLIPRLTYRPVTSRATTAPFRTLMLLTVVALTSLLCSAQDELIRLISPDTLVLGGMRRTSAPEQDILWVVARNNISDLNQLITLTNSDAGRRFDRVVVTDSASQRDSLGDHLLLAQGRFSPGRITAHAVSSGWTRSTYDNVSVLMLKPGASEEERWLAVPDNHIALLGTPAGVRSALDRYMRHAAVDPGIAERIRRVPTDDLAWSSLPLTSEPVSSHVSLNGYGRAMLSCMRNVSEVVVGVRLGAKAIIDLHADESEGRQGAALGCLTRVLKSGGILALEPIADGRGAPAMRVTLTRAEYDLWVESFRQPMVDQMLIAAVGCAGNGGHCDSSMSLKSDVPKTAMLP